MIGLALSFTFATVALVYVISALGLPNDFLRKFAIAILLGFGISLMIPPLAARIEATLSRLPARPESRAAAGMDSGQASPWGASLGLVYEPCRPDPRRRDHGVRLAVVYRRAAGGGAQLRDRLGGRPLFPDAGGAPG